MKRVKPIAVGAILEELFRSPNIAAKIAEGNLPDTWRQVVGARIAEQTRQVRLVRGVLYVHISSSIMRSELMLQRESLCAAINDKAGIPIVKSIMMQ